jgi:WD40 repeat protein
MPDEVMLLIFRYLSDDLWTLKRLPLVSKRFLGLMLDSIGIWRTEAERRWGPEVWDVSRLDPFYEGAAEGKMSPLEVFHRRASSEERWRTGDCYERICARHDDLVTCAQMEGPLLITGSRDRLVRSWNLITGQPLNRYEGHERTLFKLQFDDERIVTCSRDRTLRIWDRNTGACLNILHGHENEVTCVQYNSQYIISGSRDLQIKVWNWDGLCLRTLVGHERGVGCLMFEGDILMSGAGDNSVKVWSISSGECLKTFTAHTDKVLCLNFDGDLLVSGSKDGTVRVWDTSRIPSEACLEILRGN